MRETIEIALDPSRRFRARLVPAEELQTGPSGLVVHRTLEAFEEFPLANGHAS